MNTDMNPPAGWYPDPENPGQLRYWDGSQWTAQRAPAQHAQHQWEAPANSSSKTVWVVAGVALFVVILIVLIIVLAVRFFNDSATESSPEPNSGEIADQDMDQSDADGESDQGSQSAEAGTVTLELGPEEETEVQFVVEEPTRYYIHTSSEMGVDPVLELNTGDGEFIDQRDDGGTDSPNSRDAGLELLLPAGEYNVVVSEFWGAAAEIDLTMEASGESERIDPGEHSFSLEEGRTWLAGLEVPADATVTVDVRAPDGDPVLSVLTPSGDTERNDDRDSTAPESDSSYDSYLEIRTDEAGIVLLEISEYHSAALDGEVIVTVEQ